MSDTASIVDEILKEIEQSPDLLAADRQDRETVTRTGPSERTRAAMQGVTFGGADEAEAWARSTFMGEDYDTALADVRTRLEEYRGARPWEAISFEMGGAALPAVLGAVATGGGSTSATFPTLTRLGRMLGIGAAEGAAYGFNTGEGGFSNRVRRVPGGAAAGAAGSAIGGAALAGGGAALRSLTDYARRSMGPRAAGIVEREIRKAVEDGNMTMQEAIDGVVNGRILADNRTIATIARGWRAQSAEAADVLDRGVSGRPPVKREEMMEYLQSEMGAEGNALRQFEMDDATARRAEGAEYNRIFANSGAVDDDTAAELAQAFRRVPGAATELDKLLRARTGQTPFFRKTDDGIEFDRNPTLEEAEIMRRAISTAADREYRSGAGAVGQAYGEVEGAVRQRIDAASPELAGVRSTWSGLERAREAFDLGINALRDPDRAEIDFAKVSQQGDAAIKAYRAGLTTALRRKASTGSRQSLPRNLVSEETKEGRVLRMAFPEDNLDELLRRAQNADDAQFASNQLSAGSGSATAITEGRLAEQGVALAEGAMDLAGGGMAAALRLVGQMVKSTSPQLTPKQAADAARLVVETDPNAVARALTDRTGFDALYNVVEKVTSNAGRVGNYAGGSQGGVLGAAMQQP